MAGKAAFGVGSFHFAWTPPAHATVELYAKALTDALNSIPTVKKVKIQHDEMGDAFDAVNDPPDWGNGEGFYPPLSFFDLTFEVFIPKRLQDELLDESYISTGTERFVIHHTYGFDSPVTFVRPIVPPGDHPPSTAVRVVREYLKREFATPRNGISFQVLGPSPFHAEFLLTNGAHGLSAEVPFVGAVESENGFAKVNVAYDAQVHRSVDTALENLFFELTRYLSTCYAIYAANTRALFAWSALSAEVDILVNRGAVTRWQRFKRALARGGAISRLHQTLAEFEATAVTHTHFVERSRKSLDRAKTGLSLNALIEHAIEDRDRFPISQIEKLVGHIEARRFHQLNLLVAFAAAVVGGILVAVITALLTPKTAAPLVAPLLRLRY